MKSIRRHWKAVRGYCNREHLGYVRDWFRELRSEEVDG